MVSISSNVDKIEATYRGSKLLNIWSGESHNANMIENLITLWILVIPLVSSDPQHLLMKNVSSVPRTPEEYNEETKDLTCNDPMHNITYVLNPDSVGTSIGCFRKINAVKYCLEYNFNNTNNSEIIIQPKYNAPCHNLSITPCKVKYFSSESFKFFECFEKYGGISSPTQNQRNINSLKQRDLSLNTEIRELKKKLEQREISYTTEIQELKKKTIDLQNENDGLKTYKYFAISFIIIAVLFTVFIFFHYRRKLKIILQNKRLGTRTLSMTSTDNVDQTTVSEMKCDDQQKEETVMKIIPRKRRERTLP